MRDARFAVRGTALGDLGQAESLPYLSFSALREYACRSRINLCITRQAHASVLGSSTSRPFELASMGCCVVANPYLGLEVWFEPGTEIIILDTPEEAVERYRWLLDHPTERLAIGEAARRRVLSEHTFRHRARQLLDIVRSYR
jgi:spore maturation protein CgeB